MIVVDCNILLYLLLRSDFTPAIESLLKSNPEWIAPRLWIDELCNVLCTLQRKGKMNDIEALGIIQDAHQLISESHEIPPERILSVARRTGCTGYDSQYIALAEDLDLKLYTFDQQILKAVPKTAKLP